MHAASKVQADGSAQMFNAIAKRYDLLNRLLSLGMDRRWRKLSVKALHLSPGDRVLDLATGTGDLAIEIAAYRTQPLVVGADPALEMLRIGQGKVLATKNRSRVQMLGADALALPFVDNAFSGATIAFGIRNVPDRNLGLREMVRVVAPGRHVVVLELANPEGHWFAPFAKLYCQWIVPALGAIVSSRVAYRYLKTSMEGFPSSVEFCGMLEAAGLAEIQHRILFPGACHLYVGQVKDKH